MNWNNKKEWNCNISPNVKIIYCDDVIPIKKREIKFAQGGEYTGYIPLYFQTKKEFYYVGCSNNKMIRKLLLSKHFVLEETFLLRIYQRLDRHPYPKGFMISVMGKLFISGLTIRKN